MTSQYRHRRTSTPATPFPTLEPGEIAVNTANRQISVGDAATPTLGTPKPLLAIRFFDSAAIYAIGDIVTSADKIWRAIVTNGPGAFNAAQWELAASQVTISSNPPSNAVAGSMWWDSDNGMLYVRYNDGDSSQWVQATAMPVVDTTAFVMKTGDTMSGHLSLPVTPAAANAVRKDYVDAADTALDTALRAYADARVGDAMAYSGMQINGSMEVSQENGGSFVPPPPSVLKYIVDGTGVSYANAGASFLSAQQAPTGVLTFGSAFPKCLTLTASTAMSSVAAADCAYFNQLIEGYRVARLGWGAAGAKPVTIAFWVLATATGTASVAIGNNPANRSYVTNFTVNASGVWEYKTVTIPGDTSGTWLKDNGIGLRLYFCFASGATYQAAANSWVGVNAFATSANTNFYAGNGSYVQITGVTVLPGTQAPTAAQSPLLMRSYDQELLTCQRYYWEGTAKQLRGLVLTGQGPVALAMTPLISFRATPTLSVKGAIAIIDGGTGGGTFTAIDTNSSSVDAIVLKPSTLTGPGFGVANVPIIVSVTSTGSLIADARL